ncbi:MAG TPA: 3'-5' exonuclease, partial [Bryobacteraceae bacterium]
VLRGSLFAVLDDTLLKFRHAFGRFLPLMDLPEDLDPEFAPIRDAFAVLAELHRRRNYRPLADTINQLLESTRAHAGFAFRKGGERVLANVYRLADLARSFEIGGAATSFRAFVDYLESEYQGSETAEAPVLEQHAAGVQLMTVHRAKGLEFPVVILADLTCKLTGSEAGDRHTDPARPGLCAQRLLGWPPWELLEATEEAEADREEAWRVAYVAATRARDLLVVAAVGEAEREGWLEPLYEALYPPKERWRVSGAATGCPKFGNTTVLNRPPEYADEGSVKPGLHYPRAGSHTVVWFDPSVLPLKTAKTEGVEHEQTLSGTTEQAVEGLKRYHEWKERRENRNARGAEPRFRERLAETIRHADEAERIPIETVTLHVEPGRPTGRRFGRLVHDLLQHPDGAATAYARKHGATDLERDAALQLVNAALRHPALAFPANARIHRELPIAIRLADGTLAVGRADLAWSDGASWTVIDYKTDRRERRNETQVQLYALALERATGLPARAIILEI